MTNDDLSNVFHRLVDRYVESCPASLVRNKHMNSYDGETFDSKVVAAWLHKYAGEFSTAYHGGSTSKEVIHAAVDAAKAFLSTEPLALRPTTVEAILVDYVNFVAGTHCGMDLALYTSDMK
jgi:hypothetical protein